MKVKIRFTYSFFLLFSLFLCASTRAQVSQQDSLALLEFYAKTKGDQWINQDNWLQGPVATWYGVILTPNKLNVEAIVLPFNNLRGHIPQSIIDMQQLQVLDVPYNKIEQLPDLNPLNNLQAFYCQGNLLKSQDIWLNFNAAPDFQYSPQHSGTADYAFVCEGENYNIPSTFDPNLGPPIWFLNDIQIQGPNYTVLPDGTLMIQDMERELSGSYYSIVYDFDLNLEFIRYPFELQSCWRDQFNGQNYLNQSIVKFKPNISDSQKDSVRNYFGASQIGNVLCTDIELWSLPDSLIILPDTLVGVEQINEKIKPRTEIEEVEPNGIAANPVNPATSPTAMASPPQGGQVASNASIKIAVVDTGIDSLHPLLNPFLSVSSTEILDGIDNDGNCLIDDILGVNFITDFDAPLDDHSHGSHVAGIITSSLPAGTSSKTIPIKSHDYHGRSSVFNLIQSVYYACFQKARVINISSGYYGGSSKILEEAIQMAGDSCNALLVTSAGNVGVNTNTEGHFPSGYNLPNLISVAALNETEDDLAYFSNFGTATVDLAANGYNISSAVLYGNSDTKSGTSMSAGFVSGTAASLMEEFPTVMHQEIRSCMLNNVTVLLELKGKVGTSGKLDYTAARACVRDLPPGFRLRLILQGPYNSTTGRMNDRLRQNGFLPTSVPPTIRGFATENAGQPIDPELLQETGDSAVVDWILIQLRDKSDSTIIIASQAALVLRDGRVVLPDGNDAITFPGKSADDYLLIVLHRNHLALISKSHVTLSSSYDFLKVSSTFGTTIQNDALVSIGNGQYAIATGDANGDGIVDSGDRSATWNWRNTMGYLTPDVSLDGVVDAEDRSWAWSNRNRLVILP